MRTNVKLRLLSVLLAVVLLCHNVDCLRRLKARWHISLSGSYFPIVYL